MVRELAFLTHCSNASDLLDGRYARRERSFDIARNRVKI